jgi:GR25 family glycosyltransferase involved in LPS biosynthesis
MSYTGFYINLDRCPDRRADMESELARVGLSQNYRRFAAADGNTLNLPNPHLNNGEIGCFLSHYLVLKENLGAARHLHIIEDDTIFDASTERTIHRVIESGEIGAYDILFTDMALPLANDAYKSCKAVYDSIVTRDSKGALEKVAFQILDLDIFAPAASSYIINPRALEKIVRLYHDELTQGASMPVDVFLRDKARSGAIKAGCLFPFVTSVRVERTYDSTVRKVPDVTMRFTAANIARYSFFIGCDWNKCREMTDRLLPLPPLDDLHTGILADILAFSLIDNAPRPDKSSQAA